MLGGERERREEIHACWRAWSLFPSGSVCPDDVRMGFKSEPPSVIHPCVLPTGKHLILLSIDSVHIFPPTWPLNASQLFHLESPREVRIHTNLVEGLAHLHLNKYAMFLYDSLEILWG